MGNPNDNPPVELSAENASNVIYQPSNRPYWHEQKCPFIRANINDHLNFSLLFFTKELRKFGMEKLSKIR